MNFENVLRSLDSNVKQTSAQKHKKTKKSLKFNNYNIF